MPAFNLAPIEDDSAFDPVVPTAPAAQAGGGNQAAKPAAKRRPVTRADLNRELEDAAGPLKPLAQFMNVLASPDTKAGIFVGPVNAISKLGNAVGDLVQRKPIDTKDAWVIPDKVTRALNPFRIGQFYGEVTPADEAGLQLGGAIGAEILGAATGTTLIRRLGQVAQVKRAAEAVKATRAVRGFAVAQRANQTLRTGVTATTRIGEALVGTTLAAPFIDQDGGNLANLPDAMGLRLPGRADENDNYLQKFGKGLLVEGIAAPLTVIGAASTVPALRKAMFNGGVSLLDDIADAELAPYMYRGTDAPQLPPAAAQPQLPSVQMQAAADGSPISPAQINLDTPGGALPGTGVGTAALPPYQPGGALVPTTRNGSAIERYLDERTQIRQVEDQRQRLMAAGLIKQGEAGQLELNVTSGDPEVKAQLEQLARQRGELLSQVPSVDEATGKQLQDQIAQIDQQMADLNLSGTTEQFLAPRGSRQMEIDLDTRPEIDTYLAQLDELSDAQLRNIHSRVWREAGAERNANELANTQQQIEGLNQRLAEINARQQAGEITPRGAKGQITKVQRQLEMAQSQLMAIQQRIAVPETTVGQQLELVMQQQLGLDLSPDIPLPPLAEVTRTASEYGYRTPDDYRTALQAWPRELLRRLAMPDSSPEVAALVKARTGRRVWQAKKSDIIDALVEISTRRGRYLPPEAEQLAMELKANEFGDAAPLFDRPAELDAPGMGTVLDADGNEVQVPLTDYSGRGMDPQTRERLKGEILQRAIDNGEVQPPFSPLPERPRTTFQQSSMVDEMFADPTGQLPLLYANDQLPTYKAGSKNADALIEELRLRFEYKALDDAAQRAQRDAYLAEKGWDTMPWEEKKKLGILSEGFYSLDPYSERFQAPTPAARSALGLQQPVAPRKPNQYRLTFDEKGNSQVIAEPKAQAKPKPEEVKAQQREAAAAKRQAKNEAAKATTALDKQEAAIKKRLDELARQSKGASC